MRIGSDGTKYFGAYNGTRIQMGSSNETLYQYTNTYYIWGLYNDSNSLSIESCFAGDIIFRAQGKTTTSSPGTATERMRITSGGDLGIGTSTIYYASGGRRAVEINGSSNSFLAFKVGDTPKSYLFQTGADFIITNLAAAGGYLALENNGGEKIRITSAGYTKISNSGTYTNVAGPYHELHQNYTNNEVVVLRNSSASPYGFTLQFSGASPNGGSNWFMYLEDSTAQRFSVRSNGGVYNYSANDVNLSDISTKKDIIPCESYWDKFKAIEIVKFKYIDQSHDDYNIGVIAQQVEEVAPEFIDVENWAKPNEEEKILKAIYTADLHHATIKVLQEAMAKIETLEARVKELENK